MLESVEFNTNHTNMCTLCNLERLHIALADKKNLKRQKQTDNLMPALLERIFVDYNSYRYKFYYDRI